MWPGVQLPAVSQTEQVQGMTAHGQAEPVGPVAFEIRNEERVEEEKITFEQPRAVSRFFMTAFILSSCLRFITNTVILDYSGCRTKHHRLSN